MPANQNVTKTLKFSCLLIFPLISCSFATERFSPDNVIQITEKNVLEYLEIDAFVTEDWDYSGSSPYGQRTGLSNITATAKYNSEIVSLYADFKIKVTAFYLDLSSEPNNDSYGYRELIIQGSKAEIAPTKEKLTNINHPSSKALPGPQKKYQVFKIESEAISASGEASLRKTVSLTNATLSIENYADYFDFKITEIDDSNGFSQYYKISCAFKQSSSGRSPVLCNDVKLGFWFFAEDGFGVATSFVFEIRPCVFGSANHFVQLEKKTYARPKINVESASGLIYFSNSIN